MRTFIFAIGAFVALLALAFPAEAQVSVRAPFVRVQVGNGGFANGGFGFANRSIFRGGLFQQQFVQQHHFQQRIVQPYFQPVIVQPIVQPIYQQPIIQQYVQPIQQSYVQPVQQFQTQIQAVQAVTGCASSLIAPSFLSAPYASFGIRQRSVFGY